MNYFLPFICQTMSEVYVNAQSHGNGIRE